MLEDADNNTLLRASTRIPTSTLFPRSSYFLLTRHRPAARAKQQDLVTQRTVATIFLRRIKFSAAMNRAPDELSLYDGVYSCSTAEHGQGPTWSLSCAQLSRSSTSGLAQANRNFERPHQFDYSNGFGGVCRDFFFYYDEPH